ncbi:hypothetical protein JR316_0008853 [Psilocybe cubensis]|uniref:Protein kinase domain-containing protein n=2 Tax=Psilocybe cubensis TaxID=181762 RepID=A0A8H7XWB3_PSICU|nr:hypothetical protein JR316_0008853 [Psilocybe cubensis]KAH9478399.1 hypothetical protein JR316_0008853 [Psilocybe cubensis]
MPLLSRIVENEEAEYDGLLTPAEADWVELQPLLLKNGYHLRPRYHPNWKPSWRRLWNFFYKDMWKCPDRIGLRRWNLIDAVRAHDGKRVVIKRVIVEDDNIGILKYLNQPEMLKDPRNNTVPLLDVISVPKPPGSKETALIVMPILYPFFSFMYPFHHAKEVVYAMEQLLLGVQFLHEHYIAHRDACVFNFMMDPTNIIPTGAHHQDDRLQPDGKTRIQFRDRCSVGPIKSYMIDYEFADFFPPGNTLCIGRYGQEKDVPEMSLTEPYDPFKLDVYQLGGVARMLIEEYEGLDFLVPIRDAMMHPDPTQRLTITESLSLFRNTISSLDAEFLSQSIQMKFRMSMSNPDALPPPTSPLPEIRKGFWKFCSRV